MTIIWQISVDPSFVLKKGIEICSHFEQAG